MKISKKYLEIWPFLRYFEIYTIMHYIEPFSIDFTSDTQHYETYDIYTDRAKDEEEIGIWMNLYNYFFDEKW